MLLLAGDIGGTKTLLQLSRLDGNHPEVVFEQRYDSAEYPAFDDLLQTFLDAATNRDAAVIGAACIGVAGPVEQVLSTGQRAKVTNLPWLLESDVISRRFKISRVRLINDFQAIGYGIEGLKPEDLVCLQQGAPVSGAPRVLIGAGTGLGQGILVWQGDQQTGFYEVLSSEGGHGDFAPGNGQQRELIQFLATTSSRVRTEDVLSGRGLVNIYRYLASQYPTETSTMVSNAMQQGDPAAAISEAAMVNRDPLANRALNMFVEIYGTQAGNLALTCLALGGVYIVGGIAPRIRDYMISGPFITAFCNKDPMGSLMEKIPVLMVLDTQLGLKGAALQARRLSQKIPG